MDHEPNNNKQAGIQWTSAKHLEVLDFADVPTDAGQVIAIRTAAENK